jgi:hypothetical protein
MAGTSPALRTAFYAIDAIGKFQIRRSCGIGGTMVSSLRVMSIVTSG